VAAFGRPLQEPGSSAGDAGGSGGSQGGEDLPQLLALISSAGAAFGGSAPAATAGAQRQDSQGGSGQASPGQPPPASAAPAEASGRALRLAAARLRAIQQAALAASVALQGRDAAGVAAAVASCGAAARAGLLAGLAAALSHELAQADYELQLALAALAACLLSSEAAAAWLLLQRPAAGEGAHAPLLARLPEDLDSEAVPEHSAHSGAAVGAALCVALIPLVPESAFELAPAGAAAKPGGGEAWEQGPAGRGFRALAALRNLLAYSRGAKAAAVQLGLHQLLLETADMAAAALVRPAARKQTGGRPASARLPPPACLPPPARPQAVAPLCCPLVHSLPAAQQH
jgi:hypothetical protein